MKQPFVCFFGGKFIQPQKDKIAETTTPYFFENDTKIKEILNEIKPHVIVSVGEKDSDFPNLLSLPIRERSKWIHYQNSTKVVENLAQLYHCFVNHSIKYHNDQELVSIFTTSYNSGDFILRPFESLQKQTYTHWEWVILDDSNGDENWRNLVRLKEKDPGRIRVYRPEKNSGVIGNVKQLASSLCRGGYVVEMDHDDELTPKALEYLVAAGKMFPDAGFFFSDFTEIHENGDNFSYGDHFSLGYGAYRKQYDEKFKKWVNICASSPVNHMTIRYLVGCPNHYRAWRMSTFKEIGGWNPAFHVADDYEIMVRTFLNTRMVRIPFMSYYQYRNSGGNNHTFIRNKEIQKLWRTISRYYNKQISERLIELSGKDPFVNNWENWKQLNKYWIHPRYEAKLNYMYPIQGSVLNPLVSAVMVSEGFGHNNEDVKNNLIEGIKKLMDQTYKTLEVMVVGNKCEVIEKVMDSLLEPGQENSEELVDEINRDRVKKDLNWWNFQGRGARIDCINFALKLINLGELTFLVDQYKLNELESFYKQDFINRAVDLLRQDPELQIVILKGTRHIVHRTTLYEKHGYWNHGEPDLLQVWKDKKEKWQEI